LRLRFPVVVIVLAGLSASTLGACGSDDSGPSCNHDNVADANEVCDGMDLHAHTCADATMNAMPGGVLACSTDCQWDISKCMTGAGGASGAPGTGGSTSTAPGTGGI
jgi:hypothetical protein